MKTQAFITFFVLLLAMCSASGSVWQSSSISDWQTIDVNGLFTFRLPSGFVRRSSQEEGTEHAEYYKGETKLLLLWRQLGSLNYSERHQPWMNDYQEVTTRIRGKRANIRTYWRSVGAKEIYRAELNVGNWEKGEVELYMEFESNDPRLPDMANQVFRSITFPIPSPERPDNRVSPLEYTPQAVDIDGAPGTTRTCGLLIRSQTLYPTELRVRSL
jgi:hypothetical protein